MSNVTVRQLAEVVGISLDRLLAQLDNAGLQISGADDVLDDEEKVKLLSFLRKSHGKDNASTSSPNKVVLKRRSVSELRQSRVAGKATKTVSVEGRKKRTYVKRSELNEAEDQTADLEAAKKALEEQRQSVEKQADERKALELAQEKKLQEQEEEKKRKEEAERAVEEQRIQEEASKLELEQKVKEEALRTAQKAKAKQDSEKRNAEKSRGKPSKVKSPAADTHRKQLHVEAGKKRKKKKGRMVRPVLLSGDQKHGFERPTAPIVREVEIPETITVSDLAQKMSVKAAELIKVLMGLGTMATINQVLDQETATFVVEEMGHTAKLQSEEGLEHELLASISSEHDEMNARAPVVTIMGHVDHGKTSLLDYIRASRIASGEAGGITQHIGAYQVNMEQGVITFLDTPGHAAFTAMRARGAEVTDIVIVVVAADDGVMPQTKEAIEHSKAAGVPMIVAVNKIDKPEADPDRVKQELATMEVVPEEWGGNTQFVNVSAKSGEGVDELLEALLLQSEILELKAPNKGPSSGIVIEARLEKGRGPVATLLVQKGLLNKGDVVLCGEEFGRVRAMFNEDAKQLDQAAPSTPVEILGLSGAPRAGEEFNVVNNERKARELAMHREEKSRSKKLAEQQAAKLDELFTRMESGDVSELNLVVKADVQGSLEALRDSLTGLSNDEVAVRVVSGGVGGINEGDVNLAIASNAIIIGFNVRADSSSRKLIEEKGLDLHYYSIIYEVIDEVKRSINGLLAPEIKEQIVGVAEVRDVFRSPKFGSIAGCMVREGLVMRNLPIRVLRDNVVIYEGQLESLRRFKDDVPEVKNGMECGIGVKNYNDVKAGDQIEVYERVEVTREIV